RRVADGVAACGADVVDGAARADHQRVEVWRFVRAARAYRSELADRAARGGAAPLTNRMARARWTAGRCAETPWLRHALYPGQHRGREAGHRADRFCPGRAALRDVDPARGRESVGRVG